MNFIERFFGVNNAVLCGRLQDAGFTAEQAGKLLPEAASGILKAYQHKDIELIISALEADEPTQLLDTVNINAIANNIGMHPDQVKTGFEVFAPLMSEAFVKYSGGIVGAAASIAWGSTSDFLNLVKKTV